MTSVAESESWTWKPYKQFVIVGGQRYLHSPLEVGRWPLKSGFMWVDYIYYPGNEFSIAAETSIPFIPWFFLPFPFFHLPFPFHFTFPFPPFPFPWFSSPFPFPLIPFSPSGGANYKRIYGPDETGEGGIVVTSWIIQGSDLALTKAKGFSIF